MGSDVLDEETRRGTIPDEVFAELRMWILSGRFKAGERLPAERDLAVSLGTNRNTLREAIRRLQQARLVTVRQGQGVTVADFRRTGGVELLEPFLLHSSDAAERIRAMGDLLAARTVVMDFAIQLAVERADASDVQRLSDARLLLERAHAAQDRLSLATGYQQWLDILISASRSLPTRWVANPFLDLNRSFMDQFPLLWVLDPTFPVYLQAVETAMRVGSVEQALKASRSYHDRIDAVVRELLQQVIDAGAASAGPAGVPRRE